MTQHDFSGGLTTEYKTHVLKLTSGLHHIITVVTQATFWWETGLTLVKLQEIGLGVHLAVKVCYKKAISFLSYSCAYTHIRIYLALVYCRDAQYFDIVLLS